MMLSSLSTKYICKASKHGYKDMLSSSATTYSTSMRRHCVHCAVSHGRHHHRPSSLSSHVSYYGYNFVNKKYSYDLKNKKHTQTPRQWYSHRLGRFHPPPMSSSWLGDLAWKWGLSSACCHSWLVTRLGVVLDDNNVIVVLLFVAVAIVAVHELL